MYIFTQEKRGGILVTTDQSVKIIHTAMYDSLNSIYKCCTLRLLAMHEKVLSQKFLFLPPNAPFIEHIKY